MDFNLNLKELLLLLLVLILFLLVAAAHEITHKVKEAYKWLLNQEYLRIRLSYMKAVWNKLTS